MVLHLRRGEADDLESPSSVPFSPNVTSRMVQLIDVSIDITPTVLRQAIEELRRTHQVVSPILRNRSLHSLAQAWCLVEQLRSLTTRPAHILLYNGTSPFPLLHGAPAYTPVRLIRYTYVPSRSPSTVVSSIDLLSQHEYYPYYPTPPPLSHGYPPY
jgi:hypothetical protein